MRMARFSAVIVSAALAGVFALAPPGAAALSNDMMNSIDDAGITGHPDADGLIAVYTRDHPGFRDFVLYATDDADASAIAAIMKHVGGGLPNNDEGKLLSKPEANILNQKEVGALGAGTRVVDHRRLQNIIGVNGNIGRAGDAGSAF